MAMPYSDDALHIALPRILAEKLAETRAILAGLQLEPEVSVHALRKQLKRTRALLRLARPAIAGDHYRKLNKTTRDIGRLFSELRDATVLLESAELLAAPEAEPQAPGSFDTVLARLRAEKAERLADVQRIDALLSSAVGMLAAAEGLLSAAEFSPRPDCYRAGFVRTAGAAASRFHRVRRGTRSAHAYHELRKQVKYLWHQHEILGAAAPGAVAERTGDLQHLAGLLGLAHDAAALQDWLGSTAPDLPVDEVAKMAVLLRRHRLDQEGAALAHALLFFLVSPLELADGLPVLSGCPAPGD